MIGGQIYHNFFSDTTQRILAAFFLILFSFHERRSLGQMTSDPMFRSELAPFGNFLLTDIYSNGAAGMEGTTRRWVGGAGDITSENDPLSFFFVDGIG